MIDELTKSGKLKKVIAESVEKYSNLKEYGQEWTPKLEMALRDLEAMKSHNMGESGFARDLIAIQNDHGLSDYETFLVGKKSNYPTYDKFWEKMGGNFAKFIGKTSEDPQIGTDQLPAGGEQKYSTQEPGGEIGAANTTTATWREGIEQPKEESHTEEKMINGLSGAAFFESEPSIVSLFNNTNHNIKVSVKKLGTSFFVKIDLQDTPGYV